jgi:hypothetical protein
MEPDTSIRQNITAWLEGTGRLTSCCSEIEGVDEGTASIRFQLPISFELGYFGKMFVGIWPAGAALQLTQLALLAGLQRHPTGQRILQRAHHVDVGGHPVGGVAGAVGF